MFFKKFGMLFVELKRSKQKKGITGIEIIAC
jgi:hypothetical protein